MESSQSGEKRDVFLGLVTYGTLGVLFTPVLLWLARQTGEYEQLSQACVLMLALWAFLLWENREKLRLVLNHDRLSLGCMVGAFVLVVAQMILHLPVLILLALLLAMAGLLRFTFGRQASVTTTPLVVAFGLFVFLALFLPAFDWPLRFLAGKWSATLLGMLGSSTGLYLVQQPDLNLILESAGRPFMVAAECNGFGMLSSLLLLTLTLGIYRRVVWGDLALLLAGAVFLALTSNLLRIVIIVLLAPHVSHYHLMHEIAGIAIFYLTLGWAGWMVWTYPRLRPEPS